jgi:hypothetical protein
MSGNTSIGVFSVNSPLNPRIEKMLTTRIAKIGKKYLTN